ncbi:hypothetical protein A4A49_36890 [Nicotiana attenuata]|uniref:RNase H type-1 domain-containing protein n=1 Tax=Nicotiana attenuata TaxID=49451 RepID=A0A1J6JSP7_NICAT|nr:hypothetical protein A4A49_36890 [Nicotiana attenuata]
MTNSNGQMWCFWKGLDHSIFIANTDQQLILNMKDTCNEIGTFVTAIYAKCTPVEREDLCDSIGNIHNQINGPWCMGGDFNVIMDPDEKLGRLPHRMPKSMEFINCMEACGLSDISFIVPKYTSCNYWRPSRRIWKRKHFNLNLTKGDNNILKCIPQIVTAHDNTLLTKKPDEEEIKQAVFSMGKDSSPRPDGYNESLLEIVLQGWILKTQQCVDVVKLMLGRPCNMSFWRVEHPRKLIGGIVRDSSGDFIFAFSVPIQANRSSQPVATTVRFGVKWCIQRGYSNIHVETDSLIVTNILIKQNTNNLKLQHIINDTTALLGNTVNCISHYLREANQVADLLAKLASISGNRTSYHSQDHLTREMYRTVKTTDRAADAAYSGQSEVINNGSPGDSSEDLMLETQNSRKSELPVQQGRGNMNQEDKDFQGLWTSSSSDYFQIATDVAEIFSPAKNKILAP